MDVTLRYFLFALVILGANGLGAILGAGSTVIAAPPAIMLMGLQAVRPVLTVYGLVLNLLILVVAWRQVAWTHAVRMLAWMTVGMPLGLLAWQHLPEVTLKRILAVFILVVSVRALRRCRSDAANEVGPGLQRLPERAFDLVLAGAGVIHGAFSTGGPLLILYTAEKVVEKGAVRATQAFTWVVLNVILCAQMHHTGQFTPLAWQLVGFGLPFLLVGAWLGNRMHHRVDQAVFTRITYGLLLVTGLLLL